MFMIKNYTFFQYHQKKQKHFGSQKITRKCRLVCQISAHHKPLGVLLYVFVCGNGNGHCLLVTIVIVGLDIFSSFQSLSILRWNRQHSEYKLLLACTDQVHHLLMGGTFHTHPITGEKVRAREQWWKKGGRDRKKVSNALFFHMSIYVSTLYKQGEQIKHLAPTTLQWSENSVV